MNFYNTCFACIIWYEINISSHVTCNRILTTVQATDMVTTEH